MIKVDVAQNSPEWLALKAGVPSASSFDKIVTTKGVRSKSAEKYIYQLAAERITGVREEGYINADMQRGIEMEEEAVNAYELAQNVDTEKVGVVYKDDTKKVLCSPDRLLKDNPDGILEIKCPKMATHVGYLLDNTILSKEYFQQVQGQLWVTGAKWCDLMSYFPGMRHLVVRIERNEPFISALEFELKVVCAELEKIVTQIR